MTRGVKFLRSKMTRGVKFLRRKMTPGVKFLRRKMTPGLWAMIKVGYGGSNFYVEKLLPPHPVIILQGHFSTTYTEKNDPKAINFMEKGVTFLRKILTGGSNFYVEKWPPVIILRGHFSTTYTEKNDPRAMNSTEKGVTFLRKKMARGQFSTGVTSLRYTSPLGETV